MPLIAKLAMGSPEGAAWPSLYAATDPAVKSGSFIGPAGRRQDSGTPKPARLPRDADEPAIGASLWREEWQRMINININGLLYVTKAALPHLIEAAATSARQVADVVNISAIAGRFVIPNAAVYNATKFGVHGRHRVVAAGVRAAQRAFRRDRAGPGGHRADGPPAGGGQGEHGSPIRRRRISAGRRDR
jgi:NAD(P)-dependent dehydrogenase (short-subunit alcohol dehydrogenase family)